MVTIVNTIINAQALFMQYGIGLKIKTSLISAIYRKSLKLSSAGRKEMTVGETTNLMSLDAQRFMDLVPFLNMAWTSPLGIMLCMYFLWGILGPSSLAGLAVMVLMIPLNAIVASKMRKYQINQVRPGEQGVSCVEDKRYLKHLNSDPFWVFYDLRKTKRIKLINSRIQWANHSF